METLYRFFDKQGQLLYVGISNNWTQRLKQHYKDSEFFELVASASFEHYETREEVDAAEKTAILTEGAIYNKAFNPNFETSQQHFQKLKAWIYSNIQPDDVHAALIDKFRKTFLADKNWTRKTAAPIAFYIYIELPAWAAEVGLDCDYCANLYHAEFIENWSHYYEESYDATN